MPIISLPEQNREITVSLGSHHLDMLKQNGVYPDAPCGGNGKCGKCKVSVDGREVLSCQTTVDRDMTVVLPRLDGFQILQEGIASFYTAPDRKDGISGPVLLAQYSSARRKSGGIPGVSYCKRWAT